jgi:hypothetical protein
VNPAIDKLRVQSDCSAATMTGVDFTFREATSRLSLPSGGSTSLMKAIPEPDIEVQLALAGNSAELLLTLKVIESDRICPDYLCAQRSIDFLIEAKLVSSELVNLCVKSLLTAANFKFDSGFPGDGIDYLIRVQTFAPLMQPQNTVSELEKRFDKFVERIGFDGAIDRIAAVQIENFNPVGISTIAAYDHFLQLPGDSYPDKALLVQDATELLKELIVTASHTEQGSERISLLEKAVSVTRLLGYLYKWEDKLQFQCSAEYEDYRTLGITEGKLAKQSKETPQEPTALDGFSDQAMLVAKIGRKLSRFKERSRLEESIIAIELFSTQPSC